MTLRYVQLNCLECKQCAVCVSGESTVDQVLTISFYCLKLYEVEVQSEEEHAVDVSEFRRRST